MTRKCVLITGVEGGVGNALVEAFSAADYSVLGLDIATCSNSLGDDYLSIDLNQFVEDPEFQQHAVESITRKIDPYDLVALINNAAVQRIGSFRDLSNDDWRETLNVNTLAPALLIRSLYAKLAKANGSVVNISSIHAMATKPGFSAYATSKAALTGLTRALAVECGAEVRINAVSPAAIDTPMLRAGLGRDDQAYATLGHYHPVGRIGKPQEVAALCVFLCSKEAQFLNGAVVAIDGGIAVRLHDPS